MGNIRFAVDTESDDELSNIIDTSTKERRTSERDGKGGDDGRSFDQSQRG
jgi:hypothetical protein